MESKLGEVTGLAMAAQVATKKVISLAKKDETARSLVPTLERMTKQAAETQQRCQALAAGYAGKKTSILNEAKQTKGKAAEMMAIYLDPDADALDGFEFLTMAEAGEVGHWTVLGSLNETAADPGVARLVEWALPLQQGHLEAVMNGSRTLAASEDPSEPA